MKAYLYDENNWPSGSADARVFQDNPEYRMSGVVLSDEFDVPRGRVQRELAIGDQLIAVIAVPLADWRYEIDHKISSTDRVDQQQVYTAIFEADIVPEEARLLLDGLAVDKVWHRSTVVPHDVFVNDQKLTEFAPGEYLDHYIYEADLTGLLRKGRNDVKIVTT